MLLQTTKKIYSQVTSLYRDFFDLLDLSLQLFRSKKDDLLLFSFVCFFTRRNYACIIYTNTIRIYNRFIFMNIKIFLLSLYFWTRNTHTHTHIEFRNWCCDCRLPFSRVGRFIATNWMYASPKRHAHQSFLFRVAPRQRFTHFLARNMIMPRLAPLIYNTFVIYGYEYTLNKGRTKKNKQTKNKKNRSSKRTLYRWCSIWVRSKNAKTKQ